MRWSSHSEAMLQVALNDVNWDMFRASSSDVNEFMDVVSSYVNMLIEQATEIITIRIFSIRSRGWTEQSVMRLTNTLPHTMHLLSGNMSEYKASCYVLRRAARAAKL